MTATKREIIDRLKMEILPLGGIRFSHAIEGLDSGMGTLNEAFPNGRFPLGAIHEFISEGAEASAATTGFISALVSPLMKKGGATVWIGPPGNIFPPALKQFGIEPSKVIFIQLQKENDLLWAMEEALKCHGLAAVVGQIPELSFTVSRRLQLAVEQSQVTGFVHRPNPRSLNTNASVSRWKIKHLPTSLNDGLPGLGYPGWNVELLKIRNGKPGTWQMEWIDQRLSSINHAIPSFIPELKRKTG